ncbi:MAG: sigma 54-interacting transcriptional regulator [Planctomycetota bacterium]
MNPKDANTITAISALANCNPFSPDRFSMEKEILGRQFEPEESIAWNRRFDSLTSDRPNVIKLTEMSASVVARVRKSVAGGAMIPAELKSAYWDVATYLLLYKHITPVRYEQFHGSERSSGKVVAATWQSFYEEYRQIFDVGGLFPLDMKAAAHLFACLSQVHRAFFNIFDFILGDSLPIARLRAKVWESIFSCDLGRYHRSLYSRMRNLATLVTGPSGTGKELVARAVGMSQYIPFNPGSEAFEAVDETIFFPLNLSALSPTLIESELFGHHRGAFTGAVDDRVGWLEACPSHGAVFLDEIGELDPALQVKLLRVVQERKYCRLGESKEREFKGKIISATNRDLFEEIKAGRFREDFYFRLCSDRIQTPSLREQLDDKPSDLKALALSIAKRLSGDDAEQLVAEALGWIDANLGDDYPWSGNIRELEQCISSYMIRREYVPAKTLRSKANGDAVLAEWLHPVSKCTMTAEDLLRRYCTRVYADLGSYEKTASVLKLDRRTVKAKVDPVLLEEFQVMTSGR